MAREQNPERHDFYELLWHTGASQTDAVCLTAEDINWNAHTISYCRKKLRLFPDLRWEKEVRSERTAMKERPTGVKFVG